MEDSQYFCDCSHYCDGVRHSVSRSTFYNHQAHRNQDGANAFGVFLKRQRVVNPVRFIYPFTVVTDKLYVQPEETGEEIDEENAHLARSV